jgi:amidase
MSATLASSRRSRLIPTLFALSLGSLSPLGCGSWHGSFDPQEATIDELRSQVKSGAVSCRRVVDRYRDLRDKVEPQINAMVTWNDRLSSEADRLDRIPVWQRGSLHCVPVVVKDNIDVAGLPTSVGASGLGTTAAPANADIVGRLLEAGALILGKSNLPDFALDGTNTLSSIAGLTLNPYNKSLTVYGSSGGTAAAIAASLGVIGLGSDTYGSLVQPASATGLVSIRPTQGLVPSAGIAPLMTLQDMPGPMTRSVTDAAIALELLVDKTQSGKGPQDYTKALSRDGLRYLHIGWDPLVLQEVAALGWVPNKDVVALFNAAISQLTLAGVTTKQVSAVMPLLPALQDLTNASFACMPVDFKGGINAYLQARGASAPVKSLADLLAGGRFLASARSFLESAQSQSDTVATSGACQSYLTKKETTAAAITALMDQQELDLLVYPAANQPAFTAGQKPPAGWFGFQIMSSPTGMPSLSTTMGIDPGSRAPVGLIFLARKYQEAKLIQAAFGLEAQGQARIAPIL